MKKSRLLGAVCAYAFLMLTAPAHAVIINEVSPDAGELISTAQDTTGVGTTLEAITGSLINLGTAGDPIDDIDLFKIHITDPTAFSVAVTASLSVNNDAMLYLFDTAGVQVLVDDDGSGGLLPQFNAGELSSAGGAAGEYFLAFNLFITNPDDIISNPPTLDSGWFRDPIPFQTGPYTLGLTGVETSIVPVPAAVWLFGSGLLGLIGIARRKKTA